MHLSPHLCQHNQRYFTGSGHVAAEEGRRLLPSLLGNSFDPCRNNRPSLGLYNQAGHWHQARSQRSPRSGCRPSAVACKLGPEQPLLSICGGQHPPDHRICTYMRVYPCQLQGYGAWTEDIRHVRFTQRVLHAYSRLGHRSGSLRRLRACCQHHGYPWFHGPLRTGQDAYDTVSCLRDSHSHHIPVDLGIHSQSQPAAALQEYLSCYAPGFLDVFLQRHPSSHNEVDQGESRCPGRHGQPDSPSGGDHKHACLRC